MTNLILTQIALVVVLIGYSIAAQHSSKFECTSPEELRGVTGIPLGRYTGVATRLKCARACSTTCSCDAMQYCPGDKTCDVYAVCPGCATSANLSSTCSNNEVPMTTRLPLTGPTLACGGGSYLVSGNCGVEDSQLTASSYWCQGRPECGGSPEAHSPRFARLHPAPGGGESWAPFSQTLGEYIQVDFLKTRFVLGVVLTGRELGCCVQYPTAFKVYHSSECGTFYPVYDEASIEKEFAGPSYQEELVTQCFDAPLLARCIRIMPTAWVGAMSLRFDVIGV